MKQPDARVILLIPAFEPSLDLPDTLRRILAMGRDLIREAVIVDDGSRRIESRSVFAELAELPQVTLLRHAVNLGKGAALKTGFNHILVNMPEAGGVVTADADGQHLPEDILRVARRLTPNGPMVLGSRSFEGSVPLRSRIGNEITRVVFALFGGRMLKDTQTGLRGWPLAMCRDCLPITMNGFDYELECLVRVRKSGIEEVSISTVYSDGNRSSHFNPLRDSLRISFVFLRYCGSSLTAALIDSTVFWAVYSMSGNLGGSQVAGRLVAGAVAFLLARNVVFLSTEELLPAAARFAALVATMGLVSYGLIAAMATLAGVPVLAAKMIAETALFLGNFVIQREFIFQRREGGTRQAVDDPAPVRESKMAMRDSGR